MPVSRFIYGTATARMTAGENADDILDAVLESGITTFDTARLYGTAERVLGLCGLSGVVFAAGLMF